MNFFGAILSLLHIVLKVKKICHFFNPLCSPFLCSWKNTWSSCPIFLSASSCQGSVCHILKVSDKEIKFSFFFTLSKKGAQLRSVLLDLISVRNLAQKCWHIRSKESWEHLFKGLLPLYETTNFDKMEAGEGMLYLPFSQKSK